MIFVDTSYLSALLDHRDQLHNRAEAWMEELSEALLTTNYVLWEAVNRFSNSTDRLKIHDSLNDIYSSAEWEVVAESGDLFQLGLQAHRQYIDKDWSLTDCISFIVMRERGVTRALTHDHHFEQAGFEALLRRDPP
jgi:uncharacterized protein